MRKYLIICLILVLIGALYYVSASYYMSSQVKSKIELIVKNYRDVNSNFNIKITKYKQGIFSSSAGFEIQYDNFSPFNAELKIVHRPILYHRDENNSLKFHYNKLLINTKVSQAFLDKNTELLHNTSIIDPFGEIKAKLKLNNMASLLYRFMGFYSNDARYADANAEISVNEEGLKILLTGQGVNLIAEDTLSRADEASFKLLLNFLVKKTVEDNWSNNYKIELMAKNFSSESLETSNIMLSNPKLNLDLTGDLFYFLDVIKYKKSLSEIVFEEANVNIRVGLDNPITKITSSYNDQTTLNNLKLDFNLSNGSNTKYKNIKYNLNFNDLKVQSAIDQISVNKVALKFNLDLEGSLLDSNFNTQPICLPSVTRDKCLHADFKPINLNIDLALNKVLGNGLLVGKLDLNKLDVKLNLQEQKNKDLIVNNKINLNNLHWNISDSNLNIGINNLNFKFDGDVNLTQYFANLLQKDKKLYNAKYFYDISSPELKLAIGNFNALLSDFVGQGEFLLTQDMKGYLKNNIKTSEINFIINEIKTKIANLKLSSSMLQKQKFILTGTNQFTTGTVSINFLPDNLVIDNIQYVNSSDINDANLVYDNSLRLEEINYDKINYGTLVFQNNFSDIKLEDYQKLLTELNYVFLDQHTANKLAEEQQDDKILESIVNFLISGLNSNNKIAFGKKEDIKIYNILRIENTKKDTGNNINIDNKIDNIINKAHIAFNMILNQDYLEKLLKLLNITELNNFYNNIQKIGLLEYSKEGFARVKILYVEGKVIINDQKLEFWQDKLQKKQVNYDYFEQLKQIERIK